MDSGYGAHIYKCCSVSSKEAVSRLKGLEDCTFVLREGNVLMPVQILHANGNHWITVSTMDPGSDMM